MATEIERKYLVGPEWAPAGLDGTEIRQGYLTDRGVGTEVRVRAKGDRRLMTVKRARAAEGSNVRDEIEFDVAADVFDELWALTEGRRVVKVRYEVPVGDLTAEVDVYSDRDLRVVEVEFPSEAAARGFEPPAWFGDDVTGDPRYANRLLAR